MGGRGLTLRGEGVEERWEKGVFTLPPAPSILRFHRVRPSLLRWPSQGTVSSTLSRYTCPFSVYCGATT